MKKNDASQHGMTATELIVSTFIILVLIGVCFPFFTVSPRSENCMELACAKQIGLACKLFAQDHEGRFPSNALDSQGKVTATPPTSSNSALAQLFPEYVSDKKVFWLAKDKVYCNPTPPVDQEHRLGPGQNHWGYVINLTEKSVPEFPLIADGAAFGGTHYSTNEQSAGGTWKGLRAIVIRVDGSGSIEEIDPKTMILPGPNADAPNLLQGNQKNWLGPDNWFLNPIPKV